MPVLGATAMAAVLMMTAVAGATTVATFSAPYTGGVSVHYRDPVSQGCGAHLSVIASSSFALTTGTGTGAASARSTPCATSDSQATYDGIVGVRGLSFSPSSSASYTTTAKWTVSWNASASMTGKAAASGAQATVEIWLLVKLYDTTTGKVVAAKPVFIVHKDLGSAATYSGGKVAGQYSASLALGLTAGDTYQVYAVLGFDIAAVIPQGAPAGAVTTAAVDLGSAGHGGTLTSITVG